MAVDLGAAYISVVPDTKDFAKELKSQLATVGIDSSQFGRHGGSAGKAFGTGFTAEVASALPKGMQAAVPHITSAASKAGDAAGKALSFAFKAAATAGIGALGYTLFKGFERYQALDSATARLNNLNKTFQQLGKTGIDIAGTMEIVRKTVEGTPYSLSDAFSLATNAIASGVTDVKQYMTDIADAAAFSGDGIINIGDAFTQVVNQGKVDMGILQNQLRGLPIQAWLQEVYGGQVDIQKAISDGKIGIEQLQYVIEKFAQGTAQSAGDTIQGAIENTKTAIARLGADILSTLFGKPTEGINGLKEAIDVMRERIDAVDRWVKDHADDIKNMFDQAVEAVKTLGSAMGPLLGLLADHKGAVEALVITWGTFKALKLATDFFDIGTGAAAAAVAVGEMGAASTAASTGGLTLMAGSLTNIVALLTAAAAGMTYYIAVAGNVETRYPLPAQWPGVPIPGVTPGVAIPGTPTAANDLGGLLGAPPSGTTYGPQIYQPGTSQPGWGGNMVPGQVPAPLGPPPPLGPGKPSDKKPKEPALPPKPVLPFDMTLPSFATAAPQTASLFSAETSWLNARHDLEEKRARVDQLEKSGIATQQEILDAKNDVLTQERDKLEQDMRLQEATRKAYDEFYKTGEKVTNSLTELGGVAKLDDDLGLSRGLVGLADNLFKFLANLAAAPILGTLAAITKKNQASIPAGWPGSTQTAASGPSIGGLPGGGGLPSIGGLPGGGARQSYGLPSGASGGFPDWVTQLGAQFNLTPSTYPGHQATERPDIGAAANPNLLNRGIDWVGSQADMDRFAQYLIANPGLAEQVIHMNPNTGQKFGYPGNVDYSGNYGSETGMVHTRFSQSPPGMSSPGYSPPGIPPGNYPSPGQGGPMAYPGSARPGANWDAIAQKESSGDWAINTGNGFYGGLQFTQSSWEAAGGAQFAPRADMATPQQQKQTAEQLLKMQGPGAWPNTFVPFAAGGGIPGTGFGDKVPVLAEPGEHMLTRGDVAALGGQGGVLNFRNALHRQGGGIVDWWQNMFAPKPASPPPPEPKPPPVTLGPDGTLPPPPGPPPIGTLSPPPGPPPVGTGITGPVDPNTTQHGQGLGQPPGPGGQPPGPTGQPLGPDGQPVQVGLDGKPIPVGPDGKPLSPQDQLLQKLAEGYMPGAAGNTNVAGESNLSKIWMTGAEVINSVIDQAGQAASTAVAAGLAAGTMGVGAAGAPAAAAAANIGIGIGTMAAKRGVSYGAQMGGIASDALVEQLLPFGAPRWIGFDTADNGIQSLIDRRKKSGVYDSGGWLNPGDTAINLSRRPEAVLTGQQLEALAPTSSTSGGITIHNLTVGNYDDMHRELSKAQRYQAMQYTGRP